MSTLPVEIIEKIAVDAKTFKQLLALPPFARYVSENRIHVLNKFVRVVKEKKYIVYKLGNLYHRDSSVGPAIIYDDGKKIYYEFGQKHRVGMPAVINTDGNADAYYFRGRRHRDEDLPAIIYTTGRVEYYRWGVRHRGGDLPAVICPDGGKKWFWKGFVHRDNGPAIICIDGTKKWFQWGKLHRKDGPAIIQPNGKKLYYREGKLHRDPEDGPAIEYRNCSNVGWDKYYMFGAKCRTGPAYNML